MFETIKHDAVYSDETGGAFADYRPEDCPPGYASFIVSDQWPPRVTISGTIYLDDNMLGCRYSGALYPSLLRSPVRVRDDVEGRV